MNKNLLIQINQNDLQAIVKEAITDFYRENPTSNSSETETNLMSITEAADFLNCSIPTIYNKVSKRKIPFHKQGKRLYFSKSELVKWVKHEI